MSSKNYNENYIREAAYYNWQNAGCPNGQDEYFWNQAVKQLYGSCCSKSSCKKTKSSSKKAPAKAASAKIAPAKATPAKSSSVKKSAKK